MSKVNKTQWVIPRSKSSTAFP